MTKKEIIANANEKVRRNAYVARVCDEIQLLGFDVEMMKYNRDVANGKAFASLEILSFIMGKSNDEIYEKAVEEATQDIREANCDIIKLLNLAGYDGVGYYEVHIKRYA